MTSALAKITLGRAFAPTGSSVVTSGMSPLGTPVPGSELDLSGELGVCELSAEAGSFLPLLKKGVWQNLNGKSLSTKGQISDPFLLANPDCRPGVIQTSKGPLTKGYGDAQLAGPEDVTVRVEGAERAIRYVEPTLGIIVLEQSIQPGSSVEVDYFYTPNPTLPALGFNNYGYTFNKFGQYNAYSDRFQYDVVFGPSPVTPQPEEYGHTYTAFDANCSAAMNDPTSLRFNEPAHSLTIPKLERTVQDSAVSWEGSGFPYPEGYEAIGNPPLVATFEENLFVVEDSSTGSDVNTPQGLAYARTDDFSFQNIVQNNFRTKIFDYVLDGDFTGVSAGWSSDRYLYLLGFLEVGGTKFAGILGSEGDETSWESYLGLTATVTPRTDSGGTVFNDVLRFTFEPGLLEDDVLFINGMTFTVESVTASEIAGSFDVRLTTEMVFAADSLVQVFREIPWDQLSSYRIFRDSTGKVNVYTAGNPAPFIQVSDIDMPYQEEVYDLLESNQFFFGSLSKQGTSRSGWDFFRYNVQVVNPRQAASRIYVEQSFNTLPETDPVNPWVPLDDQGSANILTNEFLNLEQAGRTDGGSLTYGRIEPLLSRKAKSELEFRARADSFVTGTSPLTVTMADDLKEVTLGFFAAAPEAAGTDYATFRVTGGVFEGDPNSISTEGIISPVGAAGAEYTYSGSYSGTETFEDEGWTSDFTGATLSFVDHHQVILSPDGVQNEAYLSFTPLSPLNLFSNYVYASSIRIDEYDPDFQGRAPVLLGVDDGEYEVFFAPFDDGAFKGLVFTNKAGSVLADLLGDPLGFEFEDFDDGEFHSYRLIRSEDTISLVADGLFLGNIPASDLQGSVSAEHEVRFDLQEEAITLAVDYVLSHSTEYVNRQIGLYLGGDYFDPASYELVEVEFLGTFVDVRVFRDPAGKTQVFFNNEVNPSIVKQYTELPTRSTPAELNTPLGYVRFGALDPRSLSETVWDLLRYNITNAREGQLALEHSTFNAGYTLTSPEPVFDDAPEEKILNAHNLEYLTFAGKGYNVRRVLDVTSPDGSTVYDYTFSEETQRLTINSPSLTEPRQELFVRFIPEAPFGHNYLEDQDPFNKLNVGTPPFELTQERIVSQIEEFVSQFNDPDDLMNNDVDFTFSDGRLRVSFQFDEDTLFNCLDLRSELLRGSDLAVPTPACDSTGFIEIALEGYEDTYTIPEPPPDGFGCYTQNFIFDLAASTFDNPEYVFDRTCDAEVEAILEDFREETYAGATDEALTGAPEAVLTEITGYVFDNPTFVFDSTDAVDVFDDYAEADTPIDYLTPVNFP